MHIGEVLALTLGDVELADSEGKTRDPVLVRIVASKAKSGRTAFISNEAREAPYEWLRVRRKYLEGASGRSLLPCDASCWPGTKRQGFNMDGHPGRIVILTYRPTLVRRLTPNMG